MKRIIFTVTNNIQYDQRMQRICTTLVQNDFDVLLVGRYNKGEKAPKFNFLFDTHLIECNNKSGKLFYIEYNVRLYKYLKKQKCNAICAIDLDTILPCLFASRYLKVPIIYDAHEYFQEVPEVVNRPIIKSIWSFIASYAIPKVDSAYTVSSSIASEFKHIYGVNFDLVRNVPFKISYQKQGANSKFILYQGAINEGRGLKELIEAMQYLPDLQLKIAGEGDLSQQMRDLVQQLNLQSKVEFLGFVKPNELKKLTPQAWLGYNLLENKGKSYYFSLANKYFDYTMAGIPCLVSPFPEYLLLHKKFEHSIICNLNAGDISKAVLQLLTDEDKYKALSDNCLIAAKELNWENEQKTLLKIYNKLLV